ncbi:MAG: DUF444 family protein [Candidatus Aminicenantes bacterium]|nr:DUF444 family protein [Candidatus Aminicenantes bacterium]
MKGIYDYHDLAVLQDFPDNSAGAYTLRIRSLDELLERDKQREKDGFPRKIRVGKLIKPGRGGKDKIVVVPTTEEEKFVHHMPTDEESGEGESSGGTGQGEEGEVIGEQPVHQPGEAGEGGAGEGGGETHEMESSAYDLGKILTEKFQLPNLKDKGKKRAMARYSYDLTDRHRGFGQFLDKKATLRKIIETNIHLGNIPDVGNIDTTGFLVSPKDKIYRILSREKDYESQAMVFFMRDYSGSMSGKPTELVVGQHVLIYSWLIYQYARQVETRFILHDTEAKEAPDFYTYYNSRVAGGTKVASAFHLVNEIVEKEGLQKDYNIYVFHGTDGDDWDTDGKTTVPEIERMLKYTNRVGITVARNSFSASRETDMERYMKLSGLLLKRPVDIRMDAMQDDADETRIIEGIKKLISE